MGNKYSTQISYSVQNKLISETLTTATNASSSIPQRHKTQQKSSSIDEGHYQLLAHPQMKTMSKAKSRQLYNNIKKS